MNQESKTSNRSLKRRLIVAVVLVILIVVGGFIVFKAAGIKRTDESKQIAELNSGRAVVVMFYSKDCKYCKQVGPYVNTVNVLANLNNQDSQSVFLEWHNPKDRLLFEKYNVKHTPTFMVLKDGQPQLLNKQKKMYSYTGTNHQAIEQIYFSRQVKN